MHINFRRNISANFMVFENAEDFSEQAFDVKMLQKNDIKTLLKFDYEMIDGQVNLLFDISGMQAFSRIYEVRRMAFTDIFKMIMSFKRMVDALKEFLLRADNIVLRKECIFIDPEKEEYRFCYHPFYNGNIEGELRQIFEFILSVADYDDPAAVRAAYDLYGISQRDNFVIDDLVSCVNATNEPKYFSGDYPDSVLDIPDAKGFDEEEEFADSKEISKDSSYMDQRVTGDNQNESGPKGFFSNFRMYLKGRTLTDIVEDIDNGEFLAKVREAGMLSENDEEIFEESHEVPEILNLSQLKDNVVRSRRFNSREENMTTILTPDIIAGRKLVGINRMQGQIADLNDFPFTLGKNEELADFVIDDPAISRMHARLYHEDDMYYIEDLNSKNGTYLNEREIESFTRYSIVPGDVIRLAREEFCFR